MTRKIYMRGLFAALGGMSVAIAAAGPGANSEHTPGVAPAATEAQASPYLAPASVFVPASSRGNAGDSGLRAHTNYVIHNPRGISPNALSDLGVAEPAALSDDAAVVPAPGVSPAATFAEYPASLACLYGMGKAYSGCVPTNNKTYNAKGGSRAIAIVDAYDNPTAAADLKYFSKFFGLPSPGPNFTFVKVYANGNGSCVTPPYNSGWALESALDIEWAHAMAPSATLILVEACSNSYADLMYAEQVAEQQVLAYGGGGQVSNSWSSGEWSTESSDWDWVFRANWTSGQPISYFFSAGDAGLGPQYPSVSPWVISVGGTTINRDATSGAFQSESCWAGSGGGTSVYETWGTTFGSGTGPWTAFQYPTFGASSRRTPDIALDADPASGAYVYLAGTWYIVGGTSLAAPATAGIVNNSANNLGVAPIAGGYFSNMENNLLYAQMATQKEYVTNFYDVTTGSNGSSAATGWDYCTGVGTPRGKLGK
ncbi:MAG: S53 family peptidase [Proteobacteria bacterium]|nr:S53 family peptidase [Pseudomonadota bacterium]